MRLGNRITPAVSRWRAALADPRVAARTRPAPPEAIVEQRRAILGTLDQGVTHGRLNHAERDTLRAIAENDARDEAETVVLLFVLVELSGLGGRIPADRRVIS